MTQRTLVLWDIDNTLLYTGGAGSLGMARAFSDLYGVPDAFRGIEFSGRTDAAIFGDAARLHGVGGKHLGAEQERFIVAYAEHLERALTETAGRLMPGIAALLGAIAGSPDIIQALGTGNFRAGGALKLRHYGIGEAFRGMPGGFGEDSESRDEVIRLAIERSRDGASRVVVIGDTPHDVTAARANGAFALGVATGRDSVEELMACGAHVALADLGDVDRALGIIRGDAGAAR